LPSLKLARVAVLKLEICGMITVVAPVLGAIIVAALTWFLSRQKDREAAWRETKLRHYEEFLAVLSHTVGFGSGEQDRIRWAHACNAIHLVAPPAVIEALYAFQDTTRAPIGELDPRDHDATLTVLLIAIRSDLGLKPPTQSAGQSVRLWSARRGN
jgi:hypothetical protein